MSEKMTRIRLGGTRYGWMDWGEKTHAEMLRQIRARALAQLEEAEAILSALPEAFEVAVVRGPIVQHFVRHVEPESEPKP